MKYKPSLPEHNNNVSHQHPLKEFIILLTGFSFLVFLAYWLLGFAVDYAVDHLSYENEALLFKNIDLASWQDENYEPETGATRQGKLQEITDKLRECIDIPYKIRTVLVNSDSVNALAMPGGTIIVYEGLLEKLHSENGIAFVLAHELGHFKNRDHLKGLGRGLVLAVLSSLITGPGSDLSQILAPTSTFSQAQYSQDRESAADDTALQVLNCAYGHVGGATEFFESLGESPGKHDIDLAHFFSTHPQRKKRIEALRDLSKAKGFNTDSVKPLTNW